jgi:DMSO/TMAO reductase YedYZ molybdopterin-dependent catalytic subunit
MIRILRLQFACAALASFAISAPLLAHAQTDTLLAIGGDVEKPYVLSAAQFAALPHVTIRAEGHDAKTSNYDGVLLQELLTRAGVKFGGEMRGERVARAVVIRAADGYRAVFALPEADSAFTDRRVIVSDRRDGQATIPADGPLRMVVTGDKRYARWVRQVVAITVKQL